MVDHISRNTFCVISDEKKEINMCVENELINCSIAHSSSSISTVPRHESSIKQNSLFHDNDMDIERVSSTEPGHGRKIIIQCLRAGKKCINLVDTGSSTTLATRKFVIENKITTFKSRIPISFWGLLASSTEKRDIAILEYHVRDEKILIPAYVIEELPSNIDVLLGTDQIGKQFGISIPIDAKPSISVRCGNKIRTYKLVSGDDGTLFANISSHTDETIAIVEPGDVPVPDGELNIGDEALQRSIPIDDRQETAKSKSSDLITKPESTSHTDIEQFSSNQGPPAMRSNETDARLIQLTCELRTLTHAILLVRKRIQELRIKMGSATTNKRRKKARVNKQDRLILIDIAKLETTLDQLVKDIESIKKKKVRHLRSKARVGRMATRRVVTKAVKNALRTLPRTESKPNQFQEEVGFIRMKPVDSGNELEAKPSVGVADWSGDFTKESTYVPYPLDVGELNELENLKVEFNDTILSKTETAPMGQARIDEEFDLELKGDNSLIDMGKKMRKPIPLKGDLRELCKDTLAQMEVSGVGSNNPKGFNPQIASPTFFAKNKKKYRMVHDYTRLNEETKDLIYPMPRIDAILESLGGKRIFSIIDLKSGYHQFRLSQRAQELCAVITPFGIFKYSSLPMGLKNAPAFFPKNNG